MNNAQLIETLRALVEGKLEPDAWLAWWKKNGKAVEKLIGAASAERLKPNYPDSAAGAAHNSQTEAMALLEKARVPAKRSTRYHEEFVVFMEGYMKAEAKREKEQADAFKPRVELLRARWPLLHRCLARNLKKIETFEDGATEVEIAKSEKPWKTRLPVSLRGFFKLTKRFAVEGLDLDLGLAFEHPGDKTAADGRRYLCVGNYFWQADGDQVLIDISGSSKDPEVFYYAHEGPAPRVQPLAKNWTAFLEGLPKQYLNNLFS
jgi:hypothetical protein